MARQAAFIVVLATLAACKEGPPAADSNTPLIRENEERAQMSVAAPVASKVAPAAAGNERAPGPLTVKVKHVHDAKAARRPGEKWMPKECSVDADIVEVSGAPSKAVENRINAALRPPQLTLDAECETGETWTLKHRIMVNDKGVLSVVYDVEWCCGAHPGYSKEIVNLNVRDGTKLTLDKLLKADARGAFAKKIEPLVTKRFEGLGLGDAQGDSFVSESVQALRGPEAEFWLTERTLSLSLFNRAPHVMQNAFAEPFAIPYSEIAGLLARPSPLDQLIGR